MTETESDIREWIEFGKELGERNVPEYGKMSSRTKIRAWAEWKLGDPDWADYFIDALRDVGYTR